MQTRAKNEGFIPIIVLAVVAVLAIGGGVYYTQSRSNTEVESDTSEELNMEVNGEVSMQSSSSISLRTLLAIGRDVSCEVKSTKGGVVSEGTVFITAEGKMRGDFQSTGTTSGSSDSHMIMNDGIVYAWSGTQGAMMNQGTMNANASASAEAKSSVDLDSEVTYECDNWSEDNSKFNKPSNVTFIDVEAMMKGTLPNAGGSIDIEGMMKQN